ncbi:MAG: hypothetical protein ABW072_15440, partial [Sedimenticola sp.]
MAHLSDMFTNARLRLSRPQTWGLLLLWTAIVATSIAWNIHNEREQAFKLAQKEARANFDKDQAFRLWATRHGGVYVRSDSRTPPNPHLSHIPERDITTPSGKELTLKRVFDLVMRFGTSKSPKRTRSSTAYLCPAR